MTPDQRASPQRSLGHRLHDYLDAGRLWFRSNLPRQRHLTETRAYKWLGSTLLRREMWSFKPEQLARGLALGLFVAFTPTIGAQMLIVCLLMPFYPGNLPIALAACWLTNPVTAAPVYYAEYKVGEWLLAFLGYHHSGEFTANITSFSDIGGALVLGSLVSSLALAVAGYWGILGISRLERSLRMDKHRHLRFRLGRARRKEEEDGGQPGA